MLIPSLMVSYSHTDEDIDLTVAAMDGSLGIYRRALDEGVDRYLIGQPSQTLYRRYNRPDEPAQAPHRHGGEEDGGDLAADAQTRISA